MKVIVAGSRTVDNKQIVFDAINKSEFDITELISGHAFGVDRFAEEWATSKKIPISIYKPDYSIPNPKYAPLLRNEKMANVGDALIAIWKDQTRGTKHMIDCMKKLHKPVEIVEVN